MFRDFYETFSEYSLLVKIFIVSSILFIVLGGYSGYRAYDAFAQIDSSTLAGTEAFVEMTKDLYSVKSTASIVSERDRLSKLRAPLISSRRDAAVQYLRALEDFYIENQKLNVLMKQYDEEFALEYTKQQRVPIVSGEAAFNNPKSAQATVVDPRLVTNEKLIAMKANLNEKLQKVVNLLNALTASQDGLSRDSVVSKDLLQGFAQTISERAAKLN